jgi:uncharacterized protein (TIGR03118 family)
MRFNYKAGVSVVILVNTCVLAATMAVQAQPLTLNGFNQFNLLSNQSGAANAMDANLVNPWGIAFDSTDPFWVTENGTGLASVFSTDGTNPPLGSVMDIVVPAANGSVEFGNPTGVVYNAANTFTMNVNGDLGVPKFIFVTQFGAITAWSPTIGHGRAYVMSNRNGDNCVYTGITEAEYQGRNYLYVTDFHNNAVLIFDNVYHKIGAFTDPSLPKGYGPYNIKKFGLTLWVTFAQQNSARNDAEAGAGTGYVDEFDLTGNLLMHVAAGGALNAPWGMAITPTNWTGGGKAMLIANSGDGMINAYDPTTGAYMGFFTNNSGEPLVIPGLKALAFGNDGQGGLNSQLYFTAGPNNGSDGLFGYLTPND